MSKRTDSRLVTSKEQMLANIRNILKVRTESEFDDVDQMTDTWQNAEDESAINFVERFKEAGGFFIFIENRNELADCLRQFIAENGWTVWCCDSELKDFLTTHEIDYVDYRHCKEKQDVVSLITCEELIAKTGSIAVADTISRPRAAFSTTDVLLVVATPDQIVTTMSEAMHRIKERYGQLPSEVSFITGPGCNFDIECNKVQGVISIKQLALFLVYE